MELNLSQIQAITMGAVRITQEDDGFHFYRFTEAQAEILKGRSAAFYRKSLATSGVQLRFKTNSRNLSLRVNVSRATLRPYFAFEVFVNGQRLDTIDNFRDVALPQNYTEVTLPWGEFSKTFELGEDTKEVRVLFPWSLKSVVQAISLDDGAVLEPVKLERRVLCFGDSITQGYDALYPSNKYITQLTDFWNAEEINKAIGGEVFCPDLAAEKDAFVPDAITVAYGTNDFSKCKKEDFLRNCRGFYENLRRSYPDTPIYAITPIWRKDYAGVREFGAFHEVEEFIKEVVGGLGNATVLPGFDLVEHNENLYADLRLHPNDEGFRQYFEGLRSLLLCAGRDTP